MKLQLGAALGGVTLECTVIPDACGIFFLNSVSPWLLSLSVGTSPGQDGPTALWLSSPRPISLWLSQLEQNHMV